MRTLMCNVLLTRKKEMCFVQDEDGVLLWSGREAYRAVAYLVESGQSEFLLVNGENTRPLHITAKFT